MSLDELLERIDRKRYLDSILGRIDLTWDIIQRYSEIDWTYRCLSLYAPLDYIIEYTALPWDYNIISERKDLDIEFIKLYKDNLNWKLISENVDMSDVINNPELPWNWKAISSNKKVTQDDLIENPQCEWDYSKLSNHIDINFVYSNIDLSWNYSVLSERVNINFILQNPTMPWDFSRMSSNPTLTIQYILDHPNNEWRWCSIINNNNMYDLLNHNIHMKDFEAFQRIYPDYCIENYPVHDLNWKMLSYHVSLDILNKYPDLPWYNISMNVNMTMDYVLKHPLYKWNYTILLFDNHITLQDILDNWHLPWHIGNVIEFKY